MDYITGTQQTMVVPSKSDVGKCEKTPVGKWASRGGKGNGDERGAILRCG